MNIKLTGIIIIYLFGNTAQSFAEITLTPHPDIIAIGNMREPLPIAALIRASLLASGTPQMKLNDYSIRLMNIVEQAPPATGNINTDGQSLLKWMHENLLTRYVENQTRMDILLENGRYNCVSSAVLFMILAESRNIDVHGVKAPDHAFCHLPDAGIDGVDVETTTAYGFDPGNNKQALEIFSGRTGFAYVPKDNYRFRQDIGEKELIALIYQNRISILQSRSQWEPTVDLALEAWELTGTDEYKEHFISSLKNLATVADNTGNYEYSLDVYIRALPLIENSWTLHGLEDTVSSIINNAVVRRIRAGKTDEALEFLENPTIKILAPALFLADQLKIVQTAILENTIKTASFNEAVIATDNAFNDGYIDQTRWQELSLYVWSKEARKLSRGQLWIKAWEFLNTAPPRLKKIPQFSKMAETYAKNTAVALHNSFVKSFRMKQWQKARQIVTKGLKLFPSDSNLNKDWEILQNSGR